MISIAAAVHVGILVLEKDLGAALIYFVTYLMMYVATMKLRYLAAGALQGRRHPLWRISYLHMCVCVWRRGRTLGQT
ncbi:MAG: hypothetical protein ACLSD6_05770 [Clostridium sp.]